MFTEILKILPKLDNADLNKMENSLGKRFVKISKKFGKGLGAALMGGGIAGLALGLIDKLINPLKEVQDSIDKAMSHGDDLVTNAKQFGTTAGKLAKLQAIAGSTGLDAGSLDMLVTKFQTAVAEAVQDPKKITSVRQYVGEKDTADAFFQFIQSLQKMNKTQQLLVQQEVFGEKQVLKMADFLGTDFSTLSKYFAKISTDRLTSSANKLGDLNDLTQTLEQVRGLNDLNSKAGVINKGMVMSKDRQEKLNLEKENQRIQAYTSLSTISETTTKMLTFLEQGYNLLPPLIKAVERMSLSIQEMYKKFTGSRIFRGIFGGKDE